MKLFYFCGQLLAGFALAAAAGLPAAAQLSGPVGASSTLLAPAGAAGGACVQSHLRAAGAARLQPAASVAHRQQMARYDVKYYNLDLALENNSLAVSGSVWMRVEVGREALDSFAFELYQAPSGSPAGTASLLIDKVEFGGQLSPEVLRNGPEATAKLPTAAPAGSLLDVRISYHGTAPSGNSAAIGNALSTRSSVRVNNITYPFNVTWSLSEPFSAHEWFPCKQVLTDKADSSDVSVTTTLPNKVGSNGILSRTVTLPNNKVRYEWKSRNPIAYYLISVAVAPYLEHLSYANPAGGPRIPILDYVYNQPTLAFYQTEINRTAGFLENYSGLYGLYPFYKEKYGHSMAPIGGGMEHQTMTTQDSYTFTLTAHELAHQWFGDNVTCATWADIWLNESFASYSEYLSLQAFAATAPMSARFWMDDAHAWVRQTAGGSVRVPNADTTTVSRIFSYRLTYKKGAAVVHMLRYLLQDDTKFFRALRTYQRTFATKTARTADMQRIFEAEAGQSLDYFFKQWYEGEGFPTFSVRWNQKGDQLLLSTTETVSMPAVTPFFETDLDYKLTFTDGSSRTVRLRQGQAVTQANVAVTGTVAAIELDPDQWIPNNVGTIAKDTQLAAAAAPVPTLALVPNPAHDALQVLGLSAPRATAQIRDVLGRLVQEQRLEAGRASLPIGLLAPGLYLLRLTDEQGRAVGQGRFLKE